jgi:hypothetical protein
MEEYQIDFYVEGQGFTAKVTEVRGFKNLLYQIEILDYFQAKQFGSVQSIYMIDDELMINAVLHSEHWTFLESIRSALQTHLNKASQ